MVKWDEKRISPTLLEYRERNFHVRMYRQNNSTFFVDTKRGILHSFFYYFTMPAIKFWECLYEIYFDDRESRRDIGTG